ncbi:MAG: arginase family protein [Anaerolineae bacterium]|nr:arginase family protein [Anaerolineae bacterium]
MPSTRPLSGLQVVAVRYLNSRYVGRDQLALESYAASGVYEEARVPVEVFEPSMPQGLPSGDEVAAIGALGGEIAGVVAPARRAGKAILMVGGNCSYVTGVLGGLQDAHGPGARIGLAWFDAHGDFNTPRTTLTGRLGGMPVAVCAGLAYPTWRERSHVAAPLSTDRIVMTDLRSLDPAEEGLIRATDAVVAAPAPGFPGHDLRGAIGDLAGRVDMIYLHIDADILDEAYLPNHGTREPYGPDMDQVLEAIDVVMATGKVVALAVVSVPFQGSGSQVDIASGVELIRGGLSSWRRHGMPLG